jgi:hypothetical protein
MDPGDEIRLREIQREYLDFLDDEVIEFFFHKINILTYYYYYYY